MAPAVEDVTVHCPSPTGAEHPLPPVIVTFPFGVPLPGEFTDTVHCTT